MYPFQDGLPRWAVLCLIFSSGLLLAGCNSESSGSSSSGSDDTTDTSDDSDNQNDDNQDDDGSSNDDAGQDDGLPALDDNTVRLHLYRENGDLDGYVIHAWNDIDYDFSMTWNTTNPDWDHAYDHEGESWVAWDIPVVDDWSEVGFVIHRNEAKHVDPDQFFRAASHGQEAYVMHGDTSVYDERPVPGEAAPGDDFSEARAHWVAADTLVWNSQNAADGDHEASEYVLYHAADGALSLDNGEVSGADGEVVLTTDGTWDGDPFPHLEGTPVLTLPASVLDDVPTYLQGALGVVRYRAGELMDATRLQLPGVLDDLYAEAAVQADLGLTFTGAGPEFRLWAPTAKSVTLRVYDGPDGDAIKTVTMGRDDDSGVWSHLGPVDWMTNDHYYLYDVEVYVPAEGQVVTNRVTDPYAHGLSADSQRTLIVDLDHADAKPSGWDDLTLPALESPLDASIYELHVRDFSVNDASTPSNYWGTYKAFTLQDTAPIDHLKALQDAGLTHLHLLPTYDLGSVPEVSPQTADLTEMNDAVATDPASTTPQQKIAAINDENPFNWGYDPWHYTTPEGSYATDPEGVTRIVEYREMVQALAGMGLRVAKDIVYNHTFAAGQSDQSVLDRIVPGYYYRLDEGGSIHTSTCCPNTATEHAMMEKLMLDSMETWAEQYRIGAFRFDLMGHHMVDHIEAAVHRVQAVDPDIYVYGEGWDFGEVQGGQRGPNASQLNMAGSGVGTFNDRYRDAIRGGSPFDGGTNLIDAKGAINAADYSSLLGELDRVRVGLAANLADYAFTRYDGEVRPGSHGNVGYAQTPADVINYVSKHDNQTLFDNNVYKLPTDATMAERVRAQNLGISLTTLAQGVPFYHAGVDLLRSKSLDRNSYNSDDWFNRVNFGFEYAGNTDHHTTLNNFGVGLPLAADNEDNWPVMEPLLEMREQLVPGAEHMARTRDHLRDMLAIRQSSPLFRLRTAEDIEARLRFHNTGPDQVAGLVVMTLSDNADGLAELDTTYGSAIVLANLGPDAQTFSLPAYDGDTTVALHPVQAGGTDEQVSDMTFDHESGTFHVPGRMVAVFMSESAVDPAP
ncbi:MAG: pullulanase-type alpha-1,6-glucosidase [Natronospirillum sp.]|uniref:pullulanase-type alpha-1,6-glucosidase n=1 Tax=Natronospirillum sp. TaxID=2812955 RepID=UPI0025E8BD08|nr:pullulanase-type alpha-1,6-glucosidase [Natronospirillum sp.]MCH8553019.1 pullulanase-type alpha-1,6-glucosidase [Natronospirillum sp.]